MNPLLIQLSHLVNSSVSINGDIHFHHTENEDKIFELLLRSLEINRKLIAGFCKDWNSEEELYVEIEKLIDQQRTLELEVSQNLNPSNHDIY